MISAISNIIDRFNKLCESLNYNIFKSDPSQATPEILQLKTNKFSEYVKSHYSIIKQYCDSIITETNSQNPDMTNLKNSVILLNEQLQNAIEYANTNYNQSP